MDEPIKLKGTPTKSSWKTMGYINDLTALKMSSNVYMFKTAMNIAGVPYVRGGTLDIPQKHLIRCVIISDSLDLV